MHDDYEKNNEAVRHGWHILYFMSSDLDTSTILPTIRYVIAIHKTRPIVASPPTPPEIRTHSSMLDKLLRPFEE